MFGTWANLLPEKFDAGWLDPNGQPVQNPVNLQARRDLWRNCLHGGFPHVQHDPRGYGTGETGFVICGNYGTECLIWTLCFMSAFDTSTTGFSYRY